MSLREIGGRATQDLDLLLEETVAITELTQLRGLLLRLARLFAGLDAGLPHPLIQSSNMDTEVLRDLRERHFRITILRHADHVVAELLGERLGQDDILPGQPSRLATFDVTCSCTRPEHPPPST